MKDIRKTEAGLTQKVFNRTGNNSKLEYETARKRDDTIDATLGDVLGDSPQDRAMRKAMNEAINDRRDQRHEEKLPSDPIDPEFSGNS